MKQIKIENGVAFQETNIPTSVGDCYYCKKPVMAAPGQSILWLRRTGRTPQGEIVKVREYPTHKACRPL